MPIGTRHDETGLLLKHRGNLVLQRDDGGTWRLDTSHTAWKHVGRRVRIIGTRSGFDLLNVESVELVTC